MIRISNVVDSEIPSICAYKNITSETIFERDIGAHESCHMFLKLPLVISSFSFVLVNVGKKTFEIVSSNLDNNQFPTSSRFL